MKTEIVGVERELLERATCYEDNHVRAVAREELRALLAQPASEAVAATPSSRWAENGEPDPHGNSYACERASLALGKLTDDELANAVFMHDHRNLDLAAILAGEPSSIALLTAAKERIRWLSRMLAHPPAPAVPDGYALVPVEPTNGMLAAWLSPLELNGGKSGADLAPWMAARTRYTRMLAAAPGLGDETADKGVEP